MCGARRDAARMNSQAPDFAYIASDLDERQTLCEYGRAAHAANHGTGHGRLRHAARGLRLRPGSLRRPRPSLRPA